MKDVRTRKTFHGGRHENGSAQCVSVPSSVFSPRGPIQESNIPDKELVVRLHCLRYGKYYTLKEKCLQCSYLISFTQRVV